MHLGLSATPFVGENKPFSPHSLYHVFKVKMYYNEANVDVTFRYSGLSEKQQIDQSHGLIMCTALLIMVKNPERIDAARQNRWANSYV